MNILWIGIPLLILVLVLLIRGLHREKQIDPEKLKNMALLAQESDNIAYVEFVLRQIMRAEGDTKRYRKVMGHLAFLKRADTYQYQTAQSKAADNPIYHLLFPNTEENEEEEGNE